MSDEHRFTAEHIESALSTSIDSTLVSDHTLVDSCESYRPLSTSEFGFEIEMINGQRFKVTVEELAREFEQQRAAGEENRTGRCSRCHQKVAHE